MKREKIVKVAISYIGTNEGSSVHADIIHIFNTVKPDGYTASVHDPWCAEFVTVCAIQAYGKKAAVENFPLSASCPVIVRKAKAMGIWKESDKYMPKKGDWILYDWDDSGNGDNKGEPDHVGIITKVTESMFIVVEGNCSDMVKTRTMWKNGKYIRGFVAPNYTDKKKSDTEVIKDVLSGKYGTGVDRKRRLKADGYDYNSIQREVSRIIYLTKAVLSGAYGTGDTRRKKLGADYDIVQWNVNRLLKETR